jgi:hypothetical protein
MQFSFDHRCTILSRTLVDVIKSLSKKAEVIPVPGRGGPLSCETLRLPYFLGNRLTDGGDCHPYASTGRPLPPGRFLVLISVRG